MSRSLQQTRRRLVCVALCRCAFMVSCLAAAENHVLLLDGKGAYAELPVEPFRGLTNATLECWVRWEHFSGTRRVFNYGRPLRDVSLCSRENRRLGFVIGDERSRLHWVEATGVLRRGVWCHVAAISGAGGLQLVVNGLPLASVRGYKGCFASAASNGACFLGKSVTEADRETTFAGAIDEFRVWNYARSAEEIRRDMFRSVRPDEAGVAFACDFEQSSSNPSEISNPAVHLMAGARLAEEARPVSDNFPELIAQAANPDYSGLKEAAEALRNSPGQFSPLADLLDRNRQTALSFIAGLLAAFCVIHALLFAFHRTARNHLYFALITGLAALAWLPILRSGQFKESWLAILALLVLQLFHSLFEASSPHAMLRLLLLGTVVGTAGQLVGQLFSLSTVLLGMARSLCGLVVMVTAIRVMVIARQAWKARRRGAVIIGIGLGALILGSTFSTRIPQLGGMTLEQLGVIIFFGAMSVHLAKTFAMTSRRFEQQTVQLKQSNQQLRDANQEIERQRQLLAEAKNAADAANQSKSQFLASMSHELRTPLNAIIGYSEMMEEEAPEIGAESMVPDLQKVQAAAKHQLGLINDILDLSKIEAGKMALFLEEFHVAKLVREVESTVQPLVAKKENKLVVDCPPDIGAMKADQTKVRQVLFNLISNAAKFTEKGTIALCVARTSSPLQGERAGVRGESDMPGNDLPHLTPTLSPPAGSGEEEDAAASLNPQRSTLNFIITDTGIGMTPEQLGKLFQVFTQADASTSKKYGGTGLGLALSRKFCQMMGGDIAVTSEHGKGSTFTVILPTEVRESVRESAARSAGPDSAQTQIETARSSR